MVASVTQQLDFCNGHTDKTAALEQELFLPPQTKNGTCPCPKSCSKWPKLFHLPPTVTSDEVENVFREPYVPTGYRIPHQPYSYYFKTLFQCQNECLNVWTHIFALAVSLALLFYRYIPELGSLSDPHTWPFLLGYVTTLCLYIFSIIAHSFHSRSEWCHYNFFMLDYCGVGLYGLGGGTHHYYYSGEDWFVDSLRHVYIPVLIILSLVTTWGSSYFKVKCDRPYPFVRKVAQCGSVAVMYIWIVMPLFSRFYHCFSIPDHLSCDKSLAMHSKQLCWFLFASFFFATHMPHRLSPGRFDIFLHGHQLFHLCILTTSLYANEAVFIDFKLKSHSISKRSPNGMLELLIPLITVIIGEVFLIRWLRKIARRKLSKSS